MRLLFVILVIINSFFLFSQENSNYNNLIKSLRKSVWKYKDKSISLYSECDKLTTYSNDSVIALLYSTDEEIPDGKIVVFNKFNNENSLFSKKTISKSSFYFIKNKIIYNQQKDEDAYQSIYSFNLYNGSIRKLCEMNNDYKLTDEFLITDYSIYTNFQLFETGKVYNEDKILNNNKLIYLFNDTILFKNDSTKSLILYDLKDSKIIKEVNNNSLYKVLHQRSNLLLNKKNELKLYIYKVGGEKVNHKIESKLYKIDINNLQITDSIHFIDIPYYMDIFDYKNIIIESISNNVLYFLQTEKINNNNINSRNVYLSRFNYENFSSNWRCLIYSLDSSSYGYKFYNKNNLSYYYKFKEDSNNIYALYSESLYVINKTSGEKLLEYKYNKTYMKSLYLLKDMILVNTDKNYVIVFDKNNLKILGFLDKIQIIDVIDDKYLLFNNKLIKVF